MNNRNTYVEQFGFCEKCLEHLWGCFRQFNLGLNPEVKICEACVREVISRVVNSVCSAWNDDIIKELESDVDYKVSQNG